MPHAVLSAPRNLQFTGITCFVFTLVMRFPIKFYENCSLIGFSFNRKTSEDPCILYFLRGFFLCAVNEIYLQIGWTILKFGFYGNNIMSVLCKFNWFNCLQLLFMYIDVLTTFKVILFNLGFEKNGLLSVLRERFLGVRGNYLLNQLEDLWRNIWTIILFNQPNSKSL